MTLYCPNCGLELEPWITEEELLKVKECCKTFRKWTGQPEVKK